jgi:AraC-like DNA-binding protein
MKSSMLSQEKQSLQLLHSSYQPDCKAIVDKYFENYYTLQLITSGELFLSYDKRECLIKAPCFFSCYPGVHIRFHRDPNSKLKWEHYHIAFSGEKVQEWIRSGLFFFGEKELATIDGYLENMQKIIAIFKEAKPWATERVSARIESLLADLAHDYQHKVKPPWLQTCIENIQVHSPPDYQVLSKKCHLSLSHLRKMFKSMMGVSLHNYWIDLRLRHACKMIMDSRLSLEGIALDLGYSDVSFFSRQFKQCYGVSPKDYRKSFLTLDKNK